VNKRTVYISIKIVKSMLNIVAIYYTDGCQSFCIYNFDVSINPLASLPQQVKTSCLIPQ
jgi:hypothetical protein